MNHIILITTFLLFTGAAFSQAGNEIMFYNYATKGFKSQLENGLDPVKEGYTITKFTEVKMKTIQMREFIMWDKRTYEIACNIIAVGDLANETDLNKIDFFCIPSKNASAEFWEKCLSDIRKKYENNPELLMEVLGCVLKFDSQISYRYIKALQPKK